MVSILVEANIVVGGICSNPLGSGGLVGVVVPLLSGSCITWAILVGIWDDLISPCMGNPLRDLWCKNCFLLICHRLF